MPFRVINDEAQRTAEANVAALNSHRDEVVRFMVNLSEARIAEAAKELDECAYLFEHAEGINDADNSFSRVKLADAGLGLGQAIVPALVQLAERLLEVAGKGAVRQVCGGHYVNGRHIPSRYTLPENCGTVVGKVKAALTR
jgi:hypothetical protein